MTTDTCMKPKTRNTPSNSTGDSASRRKDGTVVSASRQLARRRDWSETTTSPVDTASGGWVLVHHTKTVMDCCNCGKSTAKHAASWKCPGCGVHCCHKCRRSWDVKTGSFGERKAE